MIALALLLLLQAPGRPPTVGDTLWVTRTVPVPARWAVRAADWSPDDPVERIGDPVVRRDGDSATVAYPLVAWRPGEHAVEIPGPLLLAPSGEVDSLPARTVTLRVTSVLPRGVPESTLAPQPPAGIVPRVVRSWVPPALLLVGAALAVLPLHLWWRRRGPAAPPAPPAVEPAELPVERWTRAGETHAIVTAATVRLRNAIAERAPEIGPGLDTAACVALLRRARPGWPVADIAAVLEALDRARFAPEASRDAAALHARATGLADRLEAAA